jgi:hypothetical protein
VKKQLNKPITKSAFEKWFKSQFNDYPNWNKREQLSLEVRALRMQLIKAETELRKYEQLDADHRAALYGWQARLDYEGE